VYTGLAEFPALIPPSLIDLKHPLTGHSKIQTAAIGVPKYLDGPLPPTFRISWRCPKKQGWQHLQFFPWSVHNPWTRLSPSRVKPMRPGISQGERNWCTHKFQGQRRCGEACGERFEKMACKQFLPMSCGARGCVRGGVPKKWSTGEFSLSRAGSGFPCGE